MIGLINDHALLFENVQIVKTVYSTHSIRGDGGLIDVTDFIVNMKRTLREK